MRGPLHPLSALLSPFLLCCAVLVGATSAYGDPIYSWKDKEGRTIFSSSPGSPKAKRRELPEIMRHKVPAPTVLNAEACASKDGKLCSAGPAEGGSVRCVDGSIDHEVLFRQVCPAALLEVRDLHQPPDSHSLTVVVRNVRDASAHDVTFALAPRRSEQLRAEGPKVIGPHGIAQYVLYIPQGILPGNSRRPTSNQLLISCASCGQPVDNYR